MLVIFPLLKWSQYNDHAVESGLAPDLTPNFKNTHIVSASILFHPHGTMVVYLSVTSTTGCRYASNKRSGPQW